MLKKLLIHFIILCTSLVFISCGQQAINSNSDDEERSKQFQKAPDQSTDKTFLAAFDVIQKKCISCHTGFHNNWGGFNNSEKWLSSGLVVAKKVNSSELMTRLQNYGSNMPIGNSALSEAELNSLIKWIENL